MIKYLFFDCMETLVEVDTIKGDKDYARLCYYGSGLEDHWESFNKFYKEYLKAKKIDIESNELYKESSMKSRLSYIFNENGLLLDKLYINYNKNYYRECSLYHDVKDVLEGLHKKYKLVIVSNFKVEFGVETILEKLGIINYFDSIISSIDVGWRKPHFNFYKYALEKTGANIDEVLFIGDDINNDYYGASEFGFNSVLLDRNNKNSDIDKRIITLKDLDSYINRS